MLHLANCIEQQKYKRCCCKRFYYNSNIGKLCEVYHFTILQKLVIQVYAKIFDKFKILFLRPVRINTRLNIYDGAARKDLARSTNGHVISKAVLVGKYSRS